MNKHLFFEKLFPVSMFFPVLSSFERQPKEVVLSREASSVLRLLLLARLLF